MESVRMHVLLAVANASDRRRFVEYLRESGSLHLTVETVGSLARCLQVLGEAAFDVVIFDTDRADGPGEAEAVRSLVEAAPGVPAIILASDIGATGLETSLEVPANVEVIAKRDVAFGVLSPAILRVTAAAGRVHEIGSQAEAIPADAEALMARGLAHDFNNLLGIIAANVEMARTSAGDWLDEALETIGEARSLARQLLTVRERRSVSMEQVDAGELLRSTLRLLRASLGPEVGTTLRLEPGSHPVHGDRVQLSRVLTNLLLNARDAVLERCAGPVEGYTPEIVLTLTSRNAGGRAWVDIAIEDNGSGISREKVVRIFEPFFTTKGARGGSGLGLATCRRIVAEHGGELSVSSVEGEGTRFLISLPALVTPPPRRAARFAPVTGGSTPTVLLVDDEHRVVRVLALALEREGYRVLTATSAGDALRLAESGPVDAVLLDVWMPGIDGWQTLADLRAAGIGAPVILMSGVPLEDDLRSLQAAALLSKPFSITELVAAVEEVVGTPEPVVLPLAS